MGARIRLGLFVLLACASCSKSDRAGDDSKQAASARPESAPAPTRAGERDGLRGPSQGDTKSRKGPMAATTTSLSGRLTGAQIEEVVGNDIDAFAKCTKTDATVGIKAIVSGDGKVLEVGAPRSDPDNPQLRDCVTQAFSKLVFPRSNDNRSSPLAFDLSLKPNRVD